MDVLLPPDDGHFRAQTASRLPTYRHADLQGPNMMTAAGHNDILQQQKQELGIETSSSRSDSKSIAISSAAGPDSATSPHPHPHPHPHLPSSSSPHARNHSTSSAATPSGSQKPLPAVPRPKTFTSLSDFTPVASPPQPRKVPASNSRNGLGGHDRNGPPPAMITQRSYPLENSTTQDWVATQQSPSTATTDLPPASPAHHPKSSRSSTDNKGARPLIQPIRAFKPSFRRSVEMASDRTSSLHDQDSTLRALEGFSSQQVTTPPEQDEHNSDDSDLFLRAAREEELAQQTSNSNNDRLIRSDKRRSQIGQRASLPPSSTSYHPSISRRRGSDHDDPTVLLRPLDEPEGMNKALTYRPAGRERPSALDDINRSRYYGSNSRSTPVTPRAFGSRELSPESQVSHSGRRPSIPDASLPSRTNSYRQSNLSYSTPRTYNSSPLVSRTTNMHMHETSETPRGADGTESTVSTTAPSTVWDELEELKSRIHRLELTGKLPATSGAAISRASSERPPTATTTVTTMSSSPKRGRNNSISPIDSAAAEAPAESHPLLTSALAKSKPLLNPEIYKALEAAAADALAITSMMGTSGQPGPISSSQSTVGGVPTVSDRQVRRKADSMCRSLTELCLALSEGRSDHNQVVNQPIARPMIDEQEVRQSIEEGHSMRQGMSGDLARVKSSPRALSRLEARRSSLLTGSALPSPRYAPSEIGTPTQSSLAGRRTSLLLRGTRRGTEEPQENDEIRFRAPSRATTDIGQFRNSPREYVSQQPLPERPSPGQSSLPVRRHYAPTTLANAGHSMPPVSSQGGRRYLDRVTPERDTVSMVGRLAEDRALRKSSIGQSSLLGRTGSLTRKTRQHNSADLSAGQTGGYQ